MMQCDLDCKGLLFHPLTPHSPDIHVPLLIQSHSLSIKQRGLTVKQVVTWLLLFSISIGLISQILCLINFCHFFIVLAASFCSPPQLHKLFWLTNYLKSGINCPSLGVVMRHLSVTTICAQFLICFCVSQSYKEQKETKGTKRKSQQASFQTKATSGFDIWN